MTNDTTPAAMPSPARSPRTSVLRRGAIAAALLGGGVVIGAAGFATAQGAMGPGGWHHHGAPRIGIVQFFVRNALENVGATSDQETKVHDVIAAAYQKLEPADEDHAAMGKKVIDLLRAPTIDRAAAEKLRLEAISRLDARSKLIVDAALDAAAQLTPNQRVKLAQNAEARMAEHEHGGWHRWGGPTDGAFGPGPMDHGATDHAGGDHD